MLDAFGVQSHAGGETVPVGIPTGSVSTGARAGTGAAACVVTVRSNLAVGGHGQAALPLFRARSGSAATKPREWPCPRPGRGRVCRLSRVAALLDEMDSLYKFVIEAGGAAPFRPALPSPFSGAAFAAVLRGRRRSRQ